MQHRQPAYWRGCGIFTSIYWWNPDQDDAFDKVWKSFIDGHQGELAGSNASGTKSYGKEAWLEAL